MPLGRAAVYVASSHSESEQVGEALRFAASAVGAGVAMVTGALLGALHGVDVLPVEVVSRLELAWATDTLARDLVAELSGAPGGRETLTEMCRRGATGTFAAIWPGPGGDRLHRLQFSGSLDIDWMTKTRPSSTPAGRSMQSFRHPADVPT